MGVEEQALERSVLERKERDELAAIAEAMGVKAGARTSKANLIGQILREAGIETGEEEKPKRSPKAKSENGVTNGEVAEVTDAGETSTDESPSDQPAAAKTATADADESRSEQQSFTETEAEPERQSDAGQQSQQNQQNQERQGGRGNQAFGGGVAEPGNRRSRRRRGRDRERGDRQPQEQGEREQQFQGEPVPVNGLLDLRDEGYGFLRTGGYLSSGKDVYVSLSQVRRFALRKGDYVSGASRPASSSEKYPALLRID